MPRYILPEVKKLRSFLRTAIYITSLAAVGALMGLLAAYLYVWPQLPDVESLKEVHLQTPMRIFTRDGALIAEFGEKRRIPVSIEDIPEPLNQALIATEDQRFYEHGGVDFLGLARAGLGLLTSGRIRSGGSTITMQLARNFFLSFDQTFTRKIKEIFLSWKIEHALDKRHILELYWNKINFGHRAYGVGAAAEVYYGKKVQQLSLPELATIAGIPKGPSTHNPISNPEKALNRRNHVLRRMLEEGFIDEQTFAKAIAAPQTAVLRGAHVEVYAPYLAEMVRRDMIERFGVERAYNDGMRVVTTLLARDQKAARRALREGLVAYDQRHGYRGPEARLSEEIMASQEAIEAYLSDIPEFGFLWPAVVLSVEDKQATVLMRRGRTGHFDFVKHVLPWSALSWAKPYDPNGGWTAPPNSAPDIMQPGDLVRVFQWKDGRVTLAQIPQANGAFVALDAHDGAVRALEGGFDFDLSKFNRVTQARRQPGSNIKPFIYSAALEKGFTAASIINDAPITFVDRSDETIWRPKNDSGKFKGPTRLRQALRLSTNLVSVRLLEAIGVSYAIDYLARFGLPKEQLPRVRSLALGTASITPLELVTGYAAFANGGFRIHPYYIDHIEDRDGNYLWEATPKVACHACEQIQATRIVAMDSQASAPVLRACPLYPVPPEQWAERVTDPRNIYIMESMLRDVIRRGTAWRPLHRTQSPLLKRSDVGGKTGTTNDARDAWFSGYTGPVVATAWVGFDDSNISLGSHEYGGKAALPIWQSYMETIATDLPEYRIPLPEGIVSVRIDPKTGKLARSSQSNAMFEIFRREHVPTEYADPNEVIDPFDSDEKQPPAEENPSTSDDDIF